MYLERPHQLHSDTFDQTSILSIDVIPDKTYTRYESIQTVTKPTAKQEGQLGGQLCCKSFGTQC